MRSIPVSEPLLNGNERRYVNERLDLGWISIIRSGATPVLVDSNSSTWNLDPNNLEALVSVRTKAIMVVHIYGLPVDMDPILALAARWAVDSVTSRGHRAQNVDGK